MTRVTKTLLTVGALALGLGLASAAYAQTAPGANTQRTPQGWSYDIKDGKRVPKATRTTNDDGSWREESKQGNCTTLKESSASGEVKTTRSCG